MITRAVPLKWAVFDKDKAEKLIDEVSYYNTCLHSLLDSADQDALKSVLHFALRDVISRSDGAIELDAVQQVSGSTCVLHPAAIASAASLKQIRLRLEPAYTASNRNAPKPCLRRLKPALLKREQPDDACTRREVAHYKSQPVIVEWRLVERNAVDQLKSRVHQLAILLNHVKDPSFHSLHCIGLLPEDKLFRAEDEQQVCYGLVFELTFAPTKVPKSRLPAIRALTDLYHGTRKPSLSERCKIALALAETVLQLHTSGWLHKGIRAENVIYFDVGGSSWEVGEAYGPYLAGYGYSRPTDALTESISAVPELDLYRHPKALGIGRSIFRRSFDLFALGCVILEIGLWSSLQIILERNPAVHEDLQNDSLGSFDEITLNDRAAEWSQINKSKLQLIQNQDEDRRTNLVDIAFYAGNTFQEVILMCLYANDDDPDDLDLEVQKQVVEKLQRCQF